MDRSILAKHANLIEQFLQYAQRTMGFAEKPKIVFAENKQNADDPMGKTGYYDPSQKKVAVFITGRHIKDIMRSLAHELVHHNQNCQGKFQEVHQANEGYAQNNPYLREIEREAYEQGNLIFRDFCDSYKKGGDIK